MIKERNLVGNKYGKWTVIEEVDSSKTYRRMWKCRCDCGTVSIVTESNLIRGSSKTCGCSKRTAGGMSNHPLHTVWSGMMDRCYNKNCTEFKNYGARGITVCQEWRADFMVFYRWAINKYKKGLQIDREDNDLGYSPDNCRFVTQSVNTANTRNRRSSLGVRGVYRNSGSNKFYATVAYENKSFYIGNFSSISDAILARNKFIVEHKFPHKLQEVKCE